MTLPYYSFLDIVAPEWAVWTVFVLAILHMGFHGWGLRAWLGVFAIFFYGMGLASGWWITLAIVALLFAVPPVRRLVSRGVMRLLDKKKPILA